MLAPQYSWAMRITKLGHACLELEKDGQRLIIDPGFYTEPMGDVQNVVAIVITHQHDDHCFAEQVLSIRATSRPFSKGR